MFNEFKNIEYNQFLCQILNAIDIFTSQTRANYSLNLCEQTVSYFLHAYIYDL